MPNKTNDKPIKKVVAKPSKKVETKVVKKVSSKARRKTANISALQEISKMIEGTGAELNKEIPSIQITNLTKRFKKFLATKDVTFDVGHGVIHGFIGPNGSGKTTVIKAMIGAYLSKPNEILINGNPAGSVAANRLIGYIPERASFPKHLNSIQYLTAMGQMSGLKSKEAKERAVLILEALNLQQYGSRNPISFSSGMQKKILLAQSLLTDPKILILDEPAANLDPTARKELFDQLIMLRDQGKTILISSHILAELERLVDEVTFIYYGEVIYSGSTQKFTEGASDVFVKSSDNETLSKLLKAKKYKVSGDIKTEIEIDNIERKDIAKLLNFVTNSKVDILSFRSNDLQSVYDKLISKAVKEKRGAQKLGIEDAVQSKTRGHDVKKPATKLEKIKAKILKLKGGK